MRPRTLLILAVVVGALLALIYLAEDKVASTDERAAAAKRLLDAKPEEIVALELEWQGSQVRFQRSLAAPAGASAAGGGPPAGPAAEVGMWRIVEPFVAAADREAVDRLLTTLAGLEVVRELDGAARADVGLEPPRGAVRWTSAQSDGRLEIGGAVPATRDVVVATTGRRAPVVTGDSWVADVSRPAGEWRGREVVAASRDRIERVTISGPTGPPVVLGQSGETLRLESPVADLVDRDLADRLLGDLAGLRMESFLDPPLSAAAEKSLGEPAGVIEVTIRGEPEPLRIEVGGATESGQRTWRAGGQAFESASPLAAMLARPVGEWRSRAWTRFENWRIEKARIEEAAGAFELLRLDGEWLRDGKKIPFTATSDLLHALTTARAARIVEAAAPDSAVELAVTLSDADGNEERLTLFAAADPAAPERVARTAGRELTLLLPRQRVEELRDKIAAVRAAGEEEPAVEQVAPVDPVPAAEEAENASSSTP